MPLQYSEKDVSVIIPTYNSDQTIAPLLESIIKQQPPPYEIIVVDDCSIDETTNIVEKYPVRLLKQQKNGGAARARNRGIKEAKGEIILFLDSDTYLMPGVVQALLDGFNSSKEDIHAQNGICHPNPLNRGWFPLYKSLIESSWVDDMPQWSYGSKCINARVGAFTRRSLIEMGGFDENYSGATVEDHEFGIRYTEKYKIFINKNLVVRHHFSNFIETVKNYWRRTYETMELMIKYSKILDTGGVSKNSAVQYVIGAALLLLPFLSVFSFFIWFLWGLLYLIFVFLSKNVLKKLFEKGIIFGLFGNLMHFIYGLVITNSAIFFYLRRLMSKK